MAIKPFAKLTKLLEVFPVVRHKTRRSFLVGFVGFIDDKHLPLVHKDQGRPVCSAKPFVTIDSFNPIQDNESLQKLVFIPQRWWTKVGALAQDILTTVFPYKFSHLP
jgi:hypothetical protein